MNEVHNRSDYEFLEIRPNPEYESEDTPWTVADYQLWYVRFSGVLRDTVRDHFGPDMKPELFPWLWTAWDGGRSETPHATLVVPKSLKPFTTSLLERFEAAGWAVGTWPQLPDHGKDWWLAACDGTEICLSFLGEQVQLVRRKRPAARP